MNLQQAKEFIGHRFKLGSEFVNAGKCQGSWEGIEGVVTDQLYPDPTHFVFELLQNAEDAGASQVNFSLTNAGLTYWHNGTRLFTSKDVEAITSIGQSQKRDDINQIGKFGVGFKSVFAFTLSPRISSGVFHFEITDLICPKWIETKNQKIDSFTYFYLPFNRPSKNQKECYDKISERLDNLPPSTLLFLRKIDRIKWDIAGRGEGFFEKKTIESGILQISQHNSKGISKTSYWLKFDAPSKEEPECVCSIAFKLKPTPPKISDTDSGIDNQRTRSSPNFVIVPLYEPGHLHIFFPAEKEPTGLYFLIHAPFAATVDRASIPFEHNGNNRLIAEIAELCSSKLHEIKKLGLLIPQFLEVLPHENDVIDDFYIPIRDAIVNEFKNSPLLPTHHGNYSKASDTVYGPVELRDFFIDEDLRFFMNDRSKVWSVGFPIPSRSDFFLNTLEIEEIDWRDFIKYLGSKFNKDIVSPQQLNASHLWIKTKMSDAENSVEWLSSFYSILLRADRDVRPYQFLAPDPNLRNSSVVWTNSGSFFNGEAVFFESSSVSVKGLNTLTIHPELISYKPKNTDKGKELRLALSMLGVKEFDEKRAVDALIFKISSQKISLDEHLEHIEYFLKWFENGKIDNFEKFRGVPFYRVENEKSYKSPDTCYIDAPIKATGLSIFPMGEVIIHKLWPGYVEKFDSEKFALFAEKTGVYSNIPVKKIRVPWNHPDRMDLLKFFTRRRTEYEISEDWQIDNLRDILAREDPKVNKIIWDGMGKVQKVVLTARFQPNGRYPLQSAPSSLVHVLRDANWILGRDGKLHGSCPVTESEIWLKH